MSKPRVFALEQNERLSLNNAEQFGDVQYVCPRNCQRPSIWSREFVPYLLQRFRELSYDPAFDFILVCGHQVPLTIAICAIVNEYEDVNLLLYNSVDKNYVPRRVGDAI